jgi:nucleotide-binding universal stress UspA family protein
MFNELSEYGKGIGSTQLAGQLEGILVSSQEIRKILAAIDGSVKSIEAADYAISLAKDKNASLILVNVLGTEPWLHGKKPYEWGSSQEMNKAYEKEKEEIQKILGEIKEKAAKAGIETKSEVIMSPQTANVATAIVKYAEDEKVDLIVVGTRGRSGLTRLLLGSVASGVVTYAHCPVLVAK